MVTPLTDGVYYSDQLITFGYLMDAEDDVDIVSTWTSSGWALPS